MHNPNDTDNTTKTAGESESERLCLADNITMIVSLYDGLSNATSKALIMAQ